MNKTNNNKRTKRTQKDGWNKGVFTTKMRTSIYIDEDLGKVMKKKSKDRKQIYKKNKQSLKFCNFYIFLKEMIFETMPLIKSLQEKR